jgi:hypothetical protein
MGGVSSITRTYTLVAEVKSGARDLIFVQHDEYSKQGGNPTTKTMITRPNQRPLSP